MSRPPQPTLRETHEAMLRHVKDCGGLTRDRGHWKRQAAFWGALLRKYPELADKPIQAALDAKHGAERRFHVEQPGRPEPESNHQPPPDDRDVPF